MKLPLVSILIPAYNADKWIGETINSCIEQTWYNKEIIIVDDGSRDNTLSIARKYESNSVKVISQENMGGCHARNIAFSFAQGDYIQWLDADDVLHREKISKQMEYSEDGISSRQLMTSSCGLFYRNVNKAVFRPDLLWQDLAPVDWIILKFLHNIWMAPLSWLISRKLTELAGPWDERLVKDQDGEYICRVIKNCNVIKFVQESVCYYRMENVGSVSKNKSYTAARSAMLSAKICINNLLDMENTDRTIKASLMLLQHRYAMCYPEKKDIMDEANSVANYLGGKLYPPNVKMVL